MMISCCLVNVRSLVELGLRDLSFWVVSPLFSGVCARGMVDGEKVLSRLGVKNCMVHFLNFKFNSWISLCVVYYLA